MRRVWSLTVVIGGVLLAVWYIQAPPRSAGAYQRQGAATVRALRSQVQTARLWAHAVTVGQSTRQAATVGFEEAESDADRATARFGAFDPPRGTDELRRSLISVGGDVTTALARLRVAAHRGDWDAVDAAITPLAQLSGRLAAMERRAAA